MNFKINKKSKSKYFYKPLQIIFLLSFFFALISKIYYSYGILMFLKIFMGTFFLQSFLFLIPLSVFYLNYLRKDKSTVLAIENNGESFIYHNNDSKISFKQCDIEKVILHLSPPLYDRRGTWLYWDNYFFSEIITAKGSFIISCLVINSIEEYIDKDKVFRNKVYFPLIKK